MMLIYTAPDLEYTPEYTQGYFAYKAEIARTGVGEACEPLERIETATTVRVRNGEIEATDGPFAETREVLGGYSIINCRDLDEAISYAAKIPGAHVGSVEIRPIMSVGERPSQAAQANGRQ
jgi:hypothetical protein